MLAIFLAKLGSEEETSKFTWLYNQYRRLMFQVANGILRDDFLAEDAVQAAFMKLLGNLHKVQTGVCHKTKNFVVIIVRNEAIRIYNQRKKQDALPYEELEGALGQWEEPENGLCLRTELEQALEELPPAIRETLELKYIYGYKNAEIASLLSISQDLVRKRLQRAKERLQAALSREGGETDV